MPPAEPSVEFQVAERLLEGLHQQLGDRVARVRGIEVEVGETHDLDATDLHAELSRLLPGRQIRVRTVAVLFKCADCGAEFPADEHPCPVCGSARVAMVHGDELGVSRAWG